MNNNHRNCEMDFVEIPFARSIVKWNVNGDWEMPTLVCQMMISQFISLYFTIRIRETILKSMKYCEMKAENLHFITQLAIFKVFVVFSCFMLFGSCSKWLGWSDSIHIINGSGPRSAPPKLPHPHVYIIQLAAISTTFLPISSTMSQFRWCCEAMWDRWMFGSTNTIRQ